MINLNFLAYSAVFLFLMGVQIHAIEGVDVSRIVNSVSVPSDNSALMIKCLEDDRFWVSGGERLKHPYPPASTAKIPHTLIALEEGYAKGPKTLFEWDGEVRFLDVWNQDHTLQSAYKYSVVWVYQRITRDLGHDVMSSWIDRLQYGNRFIGSPENISTYWLDGPLETSVEQQVEFLSKLVQETLPLSLKALENGKSIMTEEIGDGWIIYAKTGFSNAIGWYVGWVETTNHEDRKTYVFAFNMDITSWDELPKRKEVVREVLNYLGVLPEVVAK